MLEGWLELQFADGETVILEEGDSVYIDGYAPHNETRTSDTFELLEFSVPADMGTEVCESPTKSSS
jgi:quercetin dioxygenase-like cupin family protein